MNDATKLVPLHGGVDRAGLRLTLYADIDTAPRKDWLVANLLGAGELSCIAAAPGSAKSVIAGDISGHLAAGLDWFGRHVACAGALYVAAERSALVKRRFAAFRKHHSLEGIPVGIVSGSVDLRSSPTSAKAIVDIARELSDVKEIEVGLIVLDTVSRCLAGGDENSPKDMGMFLRNVEHLQESGAHVMLLHHIPADGQQRPRGHGALLAACDTTFRIEQAGSVRTITLVKSNDADEGEQVAFTLKSVELHRDNDTGLVTTAPIVLPAEAPTAAKAASGPKLTANQRSMLNILDDASTAGLTTEDWYEKARENGIGVSRRATLMDLRKALKDKGLVHSYADRWSITHR